MFIRLYGVKVHKVHLFILSILTIFAAQVAAAHGMSAADKQAIIEGGNMIYLWIGATHMLTGYDHLAFVFGIIFFLRNFTDIVKYVTAFTIGHSITLIIATVYAIQLNYLLIDAVIALSVCYIAFANLDGFRKYLNMNPPNMLFMIIGLGLIHGFGLSTRLQELPLSEEHLLMNIIAFNLGIELGQITALALMLLLIAAWRNKSSFKSFSFIANYSLILAGGFLFLMQMHDYNHEGQADIPIENTVLNSQNQAATFSAKDTINIHIPARGDLEYKVLLNQGAVLEYAWLSHGVDLFFEFHGDPQGDTTGYFQSYQKDTRQESSGSFSAPFTGKHGWYWQNNSAQAVNITLKLQGDYQLIIAEKHHQGVDLGSFYHV